MSGSIALPRSLTLLRRLPLPRKLGLLERLYGGRLAALGIGWVETANGVVWKLDLGDPTQRWIVYGDYEGRAQMSWIRDWLAEGGTVIDSGANIGQMCLYLGPLPGVRIEAFEPLPSAVEWLRDCLRRYPHWDVRLHACGLSDAACRIEVQVDGSRTTARMDWYQQAALPRIGIDVMRLDDFATQARIATIRLWKLDVEGHELAALRGACELLKAKRIEAIIIEISSEGVIAFLEEHGYEVKPFAAFEGPFGLAAGPEGDNLVAVPWGG